MTNTVPFYIEDIATQIATYNQAKLYRDTTPDGAFSTLVSTVTLVSGTEAYSVTDSGGSASSWYRYKLYNSSTLAESSFSEAWQVEGVTLTALRVEAAYEAGLGWASTCTDTGTANLLTDDALLDQGAGADFGEGAWIYRPDAADAGDRTRRIADSSGFNTSTGGFVPTRAWTNAPADAEAYHVFMLVPPRDQPGAAYSWDRAIRDGLAMVKHVDQLNLGEGTATGVRRFSLGTHLGYVRNADILRVWARTTDSNNIPTDVDYDTQQRYWEVRENGPGEISVELFPAPGTDETVIVDVNRGYAMLYDDDDVTLCPRELAVAASVVALWDHMNRVTSGRYADRRAATAEKYNRVYRRLFNTRHVLRRGS